MVVDRIRDVFRIVDEDLVMAVLRRHSAKAAVAVKRRIVIGEGVRPRARL